MRQGAKGLGTIIIEEIYNKVPSPQEQENGKNKSEEQEGAVVVRGRIKIEIYRENKAYIRSSEEDQGIVRSIKSQRSNKQSVCEKDKSPSTDDEGGRFERIRLPSRGR